MLLEREQVLARLTALLEASSAGAAHVVFLAGEAGIGKTAVVAALAAAAPDAVRVRRGSCDRVTTSAPLGPFLEAVPELADVLADPRAVDRPQLFRRLRGALAAEPTLLVLEDVHWADEATLDMLRFLGRRLAGLPLLVVATHRDDEAVATSPLTVVLGELATAPQVVREELAPLSVAAVRELVGAAESELGAEELHGSTGGNPFYVTEVLAAPGSSVPATVRDAVLARTSRLSTDARAVLAAAAVLGQPARLRQLGTLAGVPLAAVDECIASGVLVADGDRLRFRHELARRAVEGTLSPGARARLHGRALRVLRRTGEADDGLLAHHAAAAGDAAATLELAPRAAERSACLGAHREAAALYRLALAAAGDFQDAADPARLAMLEALAYECYLTDQVEDALTARRSAVDLAERAGDGRALGRNQRWISRLCWLLGRNAESELFAARAVATLEGADDGHDLAMAYSNLAQLRMLAGDTDSAVTAGTRALDFARRIGDREVEIHALNNVGSALDAVDDPEGGRLLQRSLDLALLDDAHEHAARAWTNLGTAAVIGRRYADADRLLRAGVAYCEERDLDSWTLYMRAWLARSLAEQGHLTAADEEAEQVLRRPQALPVARLSAAAVAGILARRRGRPDAGRLDEAVALAEGTGEEQRLVPVAAARAEAAWLAERPDEIVAEVDRAWLLALAHGNPWAVGELSWWLCVAGVRRRTRVAVAEPFALLLGGAWRPAAKAWAAIGCPQWEAIALAASPDLADGRRAVDIADRLGVPAVREALLRSRHDLRIPVPRGPRGPAAGNPARLTERELDVLRLLAEGLTNAEVARRLFLSEKTVGHHVSAVLRKLGEPTRSGAVAAALRRRIIVPT